MKRRLIKEFRQLLLPSGVAAGAACMMSLFALQAGPSEAGAAPFFYNLSSFAFFGGIAVAAGMAFGAEFQQRTLSLLISQPVERSRIWNEKMLALLLAVTATGLVFWLSQKVVALMLIHWAILFAGQPILLASRQDLLLSGTCIVATVCSAGFWTLLARSTIGGIVFSIASQFFLAVGAIIALERILGPYEPFKDRILTGVIVAAGIIYSTIFLWFGRRKFARLELRDVSFGEGGFGSGPLAGTRWWSAWLRCRPKGALLNLIRKELMLQKPVFLVAAILTLCWFLTLTLLLLEPSRKEIFEAILNVLTVVYVAVLPVLAGCISLGEEKTLGLTAWHLTLPISARRQWLLKLAVSTNVAISVGLALPFLLAWMTAAKANIELFYFSHGNDWPMLLTLWGLMFVMNFWAVTLLANTLRAALASVISLAALCLCGALAAWCASLSGSLETGLLVLLTAYFQLPLDFFSAFKVENQGILLVTAVVVVTTLAQSLAQFRRAQSSRRIIWKYSAILAAVVFLLMFWLGDFVNSARDLRTSRLRQELADALGSLPAKDPEPSSLGWRTVTLPDLEQTGKLSALTKAWLKNASISFVPFPMTFAPAKGGHPDSTRAFRATIEFPNGGRTEFKFHELLDSTKRVRRIQQNKQTTGEKQ